MTPLARRDEERMARILRQAAGQLEAAARRGPRAVEDARRTVARMVAPVLQWSSDVSHQHQLRASCVELCVKATQCEYSEFVKEDTPHE